MTKGFLNKFANFAKDFPGRFPLIMSQASVILEIKIFLTKINETKQTCKCQGLHSTLTHASCVGFRVTLARSHGLCVPIIIIR